MANNQSFKVKNGILAQRYLQTAGTETAGSEGYSLSSASYDSVSFSVAAQDTLPSDIFFKPDGTKMYVVGDNGNDINEYNLSTAWDISTASFVQVFSVAGQDTGPAGVFFKPDGLKMYVVGFTNDSVYEYSLSTAWDISTASFVQVFSVSTQDTAPVGLFFKPDGTKMYVTGQTGVDVNEYTLSTAWDISTSSFVQNFSIVAQGSIPRGLFFKPDGTKMFISSPEIDEYALSTPWDISTASYVQNFSVAGQDASPLNLFFKDDGTKMYVVGAGNDAIYQYSTTIDSQTLDLSTGTYFSFTPSGATTVSFTNPPASGVAIAFALEINGDGSAITWPASVKWHEATTPTVTATKELYTFITVDGGTTYYGKQAATELA